MRLFTVGIVASCMGLTIHFVNQLSAEPMRWRSLASYSTSLQQRTPAQRRNAILAVNALHGNLLRPGSEFSFNRTIKSWSADAGYVKAPVSFDGELVSAFGGGVCQASSTLYNAALLSGLEVVERHPHTFAPTYIEPGRDAAVAFPGIDLRIRNPYAFPVRIRAKCENHRLTIGVEARQDLSRDYSIEQVNLGRVEPRRLTKRTSSRLPNGRTFIRNPGSSGQRVATYRLTVHSGNIEKRERLSEDRYPPMNRVIAISE